MNHLFDYLTGTVSKETQDFLEQSVFGEEIVKGGTVKRLDNISYIKLEEGWEILEKAEKDGKVKKEKSREQIEKETTSKEPLEDSQRTIDEGHELVAPDGTSGTVTSHDGKMITVEYVKDGQKVETQVPAHILEDRKKRGEIQHNANPKSLKELHTKLIEEMHIQGKDATAIISLLKNLGVNEDEAMEAISSYRKDRPVVEEPKKKEVKKSIYEGGLQQRQAELISSSFEKGKYTDKLQAMYKRKGLDENGNLVKEDCEDEVEKGGEGSRGGKVIGHTKSGKPIYQSKTSTDAYEKHSHLSSDEHFELGKDDKSGLDTKQVDLHFHLYYRKMTEEALKGFKHSIKTYVSPSYNDSFVDVESTHRKDLDEFFNKKGYVLRKEGRTEWYEIKKPNGKLHQITVRNKKSLEKSEMNDIEKSGHPVKFHEKHWNGKTWVYDYGQHSKGSVEKLEDSNYSSHEEEHQRKVADDITTTKERITTHMKNHDSIHREITAHQQSINSIVKVDGRDSKSTNPMKHQIHILNSRKEKELNIVKHLHSNLVTRLTR